MIYNTQLHLPVVMLFFLSLFSCGGGDSPPPQNSQNDVSVYLPDGSSETAVMVTVSKASTAGLPNLQNLLSDVYDIGPSGTEFDIPVTIGIPINSDTAAGTAMEMVRYNPETGLWESLEGNIIVGSILFAKTDHFSIFAISNIADAVACDNLWSGGPGSVAPLLIPGSISVTPGTRTDEIIRKSGSADMALGSTWTSDACSAVVSGNFGTGFTADGRWIDYSNMGMVDAIAQTGGAFSFTVQYGQGPYLGITDPCNAALGPGGYLYDLNINFTAANCAGGGGGGGGLCQGSSTCGSSGSGLCVQGKCMLEISMLDAATSGNSQCAAEGLSCVDAPVLTPPEAACLAFNPTATVSADANGWRQSVYCNNNAGNACLNNFNDCHNCPACLDTGLSCATNVSSQSESIYANCQ